VKRNPKQEVGVGVLVTAAAALTAWMAIQAGAVGLGDKIEVSATFDTVVGLSPGAAVMVAGVAVGKVSGLYAEFDRAGLDMLLDPEANLRNDVEAVVRARSLLGEKYLELVPISKDAPLLRDGDVIAVTRSATEIDEVVSGLDPLMNLIDPERLQEGFDRVLTLIESDPKRPERMVQDLEAILSNLRTMSDEALVTGREARSLVGEARTLVGDLSATSETVDPLIARAERALVDLETAAADLPAATAQLQPTLDEAHAALADLRVGLAPLTDDPARLELILENLSEIDKWELRRLLREEGIKVRLAPREVVEDD
jgi:phospholipid/cholesterol/gamma-HCH transport system substrate-binding protein